jgi:hypothetical protein
MTGKNLEMLVVTILNVPPYQLPPIVKASGCYSLDITYRGQSLNKTGYSVEEVLESYLNHVTRCNYMFPVKGKEPMADLPVRFGNKIKSK